MVSLPFGKHAFNAALVQALNRSQAVIEFDLTGKILSANENFCKTLGYSEQEIIGKHHRLFVDPADAASPEYAAFWQRLGKGEYDQGKYKRVGKVSSRCGSRPPTTRSSAAASPTGW